MSTPLTAPVTTACDPVLQVPLIDVALWIASNWPSTGNAASINVIKGVRIIFDKAIDLDMFYDILFEPVNAARGRAKGWVGSGANVEQQRMRRRNVRVLFGGRCLTFTIFGRVQPQFGDFNFTALPPYSTL